MKEIEKKMKSLQAIEAILDDGSITINKKNIYGRDVREEIKDLEDKVEFKKELDSYKEPIIGEYPLSKHFFLNVDYSANWGFRVDVYLNRNLSGFMYEHYISSHSGQNEWAIAHVDHVYNLLSGNSEFNHAFGTSSFSDILKDLSKLRDVEKISKRIQDIVNYFQKDGNKIITDQLDSIIDAALELFEEEVE